MNGNICTYDKHSWIQINNGGVVWALGSHESGQDDGRRENTQSVVKSTDLLSSDDIHGNGKSEQFNI